MPSELVAMLAVLASLFIGCMVVALIFSPKAELKRQEQKAEQEARAREVARQIAEDDERRRQRAIERREKVVGVVMASMW